jgi:hypothetical protein
MLKTFGTDHANNLKENAMNRRSVFAFFKYYVPASLALLLERQADDEIKLAVARNKARPTSKALLLRSAILFRQYQTRGYAAACGRSADRRNQSA